MTHYPGGELELFKAARNWKAYFARVIKPYLRGNVLEVGGGIGSTARVLASGAIESWTALEPDPELARVYRETTAQSFRFAVEVAVGSVADLDPSRQFDALLYIDVLEHIADDRAELERAVRHLRAGGAMVVLAPAHQFLFSEFDAGLGHYRRYSRATLQSVVPPYLRRERLDYLDSVGLVASLANKLMLHQSLPTPRQIQFWDSCLVPLSRMLDPLLARRVGKSVLGVWRTAREEH